MAVTSVLVASDVRLYREGLRALLSTISDLEVIGIVAEAGEVPDAIISAHPDVLLLDQSLPGALDLLRGLRTLPAPCRVVAFGLADQEEVLVTWAEAGASGFVLRDASLESLCETIAGTARGELNCSARVAGTLLKRLQRRAQDSPVSGDRRSLTEREFEIFRLVDSGLSNKEIATRLGIEVATVKNHVHNVLEKLHVHRRTEALGRLRGRDPRRLTPPPFRAK